MKIFELNFYLNGIYMTEYWEGVNKIHAESQCRNYYGGAIGKFEGIKEVTEEMS